MKNAARNKSAHIIHHANAMRSSFSGSKSEVKPRHLRSLLTAAAVGLAAFAAFAPVTHATQLVADGSHEIAVGGITYTSSGGNSLVPQGAWWASNGGSITGSSTFTFTTATTYNHGIFANGSDSTITLLSGSATITTTADQSSGIYLYNGGTFTSNATLDITTSGDFSRGIFGYIASSAITDDLIITSNNGDTITTSGSNSQGILALNAGIGATEIINYADITTAGDTSAGLYAVNGNVSSANVTIVNLGTLNTGDGFTGANSHGIHAFIGNRDSSGDVTIQNHGPITTSGDGAHGLYAQNAGTGATVIDNIGEIITTGDGSHGIAAILTITNAGTSGILAIVTSGNITTSGDDAHGILAQSQGGISITQWSQITANGAGIIAENAVDGDIYIDNYGGIESDSHGISAVNTADGGIVNIGSYSFDSPITAGGDGITAQSQGDIIIDSRAVIIAGGDGIAAQTSNGSISISIAQSADIFATTGAGIYANITGGHGEIEITYDSHYFVIQSGGVGIHAINDGTGGISISDGNLFHTGGMESGGHGIVAENSNGGDIFIRNINPITAGGDGVRAINTAIGGAVTLEINNEVSAADAGIVAESQGGIYIHSYNSLTASNGHGITATNATSGDITIYHAGITSSGNGVHAVNTAIGNITIHNVHNENLTAGGIGIYANAADGAIDIIFNGNLTSDSHGIQATSAGTGGITIAATGSITATGSGTYGIHAKLDGTSGEIHITTGGEITSTYHGIEATSTSGSGHNTVINYANITTTANGMGINASLAATGTGDVTVENNGTITTASAQAITATNRGTGEVFVENGGIIDSGGHGIEANNYGPMGAVTVTNYGEISAADYGIYANNSTSNAITIYNHGEITTGNNGIVAANTAAAWGVIIENTANITATGNAIAAISAGDIAITNTYAVLTANNTGANGISAINSGSDTVSITNYGGEINAYRAGITVTSSGGITIQNDYCTITTTTVQGILATNTTTGDISINNSGDISAGSAGISASNSAANRRISIENYATITTGTAGVINSYGIYATIQSATSTGDIYIENIGDISTDGQFGYGLYAQQLGVGDITILNTAAITTTGATASGIYGWLNNTNATGNILIGTTDAPVTGIITTSGSNSHGLYAQNSGSGNSTINNAATISTGGMNSHGIYNYTVGKARVTVDNSGDITTGGESAVGIYAYSNNAANHNDITVTNSGTVTITSTGWNTMGIYAYIANAASTGKIEVTNSATGEITTAGSGAYGIFATTGGLGAVTVDNAASITTTGADAYAINTWITNTASTAALLVENSGDLETSGNNGYGIRALNAGLGTVTVNNSANITTGATGATHAYGIYAYTNNAASTAKITVTNSANITTGGNNGYGILVQTTGLGDVAITNSGEISTAGTTALGIWAYITNATAAGNVTVENTGKITTTGTGTSFGIYAQTAGTGGVTVINTGEIDVQNTAQRGIYALLNSNTSTGDIYVENTGKITATSTGIYALINAATSIGDITVENTGEIHTTENSAHGIYARQNGLGAIEVRNSGNITTLGETAHAIWAHINNATNSSEIKVTATDGTITTYGDYSHGIYAVTTGTGAVTIENASTIQTYGEEAFGIHGFITDTPSTAEVKITNTGNITTAGTKSYGIWSENRSTGSATIVNQGNITTTGMDAHGLFAYLENTDSAGDITIQNSGEIQTADATAIRAHISNETATGNITIKNLAGGNITTTYYGEGILAENDGLGSITIENAANITTNTASARGIFAFITNDQSAAEIKITTTGGKITTTAGSNSHGILVEQNGTGKITIQNAAEIQTAGTNSRGIYIYAPNTTSDAENHITNTGKITTTGAGSHGIWIRNKGLGDVTIENTGEIFTGTAANATHAIYAYLENTATTGKITINNNTGANLTTTGNSAYGIFANQAGLGAIEIHNADTITTGTGFDAHAIYAWISNAASDATITINNDTGANITTDGIPNTYGGIGLYANHHGTGEIEITNAATIRTAGEDAHGIMGWFSGTANGTGNITIENSGEIETTGDGAQGIYAYNQGLGGATITNAATINTTGDTATGIYAQLSKTNSVGDILIENTGEITTTGTASHGIDGNINAASSTGKISIENAAAITTTGSNAHGIRALNNGTGAITVTNSATISAGGTGIHAWSTNGGSATVINAGDITSTGGHGIQIEASGGIADTTDYGTPAVGTTQTIITVNDYSYGINIYGSGARFVQGTEKIIIHTGAELDNNGQIITGEHSGATGTMGLVVQNGATAELGNIEIYTHGDTTAALQLHIGVHTDRDSTVTLNDAKISTQGGYSFGIFADADTAQTAVTLNTGSITTDGANAAAILARANAGIILNVVDIATAGANSAAYQTTTGTAGTVTTIVHTGGTVDVGESHLIEFGTLSILGDTPVTAITDITLKNLTTVENGDYAIRGVTQSTADAQNGQYTLNLTLDNTAVTGDIRLGKINAGTGEFIADADESNWSTFGGAEKSTLNIDLKNNAELHIKRVTSDAYEFVHATTSDATSTLKISLADAITRAISDPNDITITSDAADFMNANFLGTFAIGTGSFLLENPTVVTSGGDESQGATNVRALANAAAVRLDAGSVVTVTGLVNDGSVTEVTYFSDNKSKAQDAGDAAFSTLEFNGGTLVFNSVITGTLTSKNFLVTEKISAGTGAVRVDLGWTTPLETASPLAANVAAILDQQKIVGDYNFIQLAKADDVTVGVGAVTLQNIDGTAVTAHAEHSGISLAQNGEIVATADYAYALASTIDNTNHDGIYVGYRLATLHILDEKTLVIDNAESTNNVLDTLILSDGENGTGALKLLDSSGTGLIINNANNDTASITIGAGTVTIGYENGLGATRELVVASDATLNVNNTSLAIDGTIFVNENATITGGDGVRTGDGGHVTIAGDVVVDGGKITGGNGANSGGDVFLNGQTTLFTQSEITGGLGNNNVRGNITNTGAVIISDPVSGGAAQTTVTFTGENFRNNGTIYFPTTNNSARQNGSETTLKINGNYHGDGGQIHLNAWYLGEDKNVVDQLRITGDATGETAVTITGHAGNGAKTEGEGIRVITVDGTSGKDAFSLANTLTAGFHTYELAHGDGDNNWYLRSIVNPDGAAALTSAAAFSIGWFAQNDSLLKRMGDLRLLMQSGTACFNDTFWARAYGQQNNIDIGDGIAPARLHTYGANVGMDRLHQFGDGFLFTGAFVGYNGNRNEIRDGSGSKSRSDGVHGGVYATWMSHGSFYIDFVAQAQYAQTDTKTRGDQRDNADYDSYGAGVSLEIGKQFLSRNYWFVEPSAQVAYYHQFNETYTSDSGVRIQMQDADVFQFSGMVRFGKTIHLRNTGDRRGGCTTRSNDFGKIQPYAKIGVQHQETIGGHVRSLDARYRPTVDGTSAVIGAGINYQVTLNTQIHLDYETSFSEKNDKPWGVNFGVTTRW